MAALPLALRSLPAAPAALVVALLLLPPAAADPLDLIETTEPPIPLPVDPDHIVRVNHVDVEADGDQVDASVATNIASASIQLQCTAGEGTAAGGPCEGFLCAFGPSGGELPLYFVVDPGQWVFGAGVDATPGEGGGYGPYQGAVVSPNGHCGP